MFSFVLGALLFLVIGWEAFLNVQTSTSLFEAKPKISVIRYGKYALVFLLLLFLPVRIPFGLRTLFWALFLIRFLTRLAGDFKPARPQRSVAVLGNEFDAVARLVHNGDKQAALKLCDKLARQGEMSPATVTMVRGYLDESPAKPPGEIAVPVNPPAEVAATVATESAIDQLIAEHRYGTAAEALQREIKARPGDYELFMKYLILLAVHCADPHAAVRMLRHARHRHKFSPEQIAAAGEQLLQIHPDLHFGDEGVTLIKNRKKPKARKHSELL